MHGWTGKILEINLDKSEINTIATKPYAEKYLGGRGIASRLYWERVRPEVGEFDPQNCLILMTGPLVATGAQGATRLSIVAKSPMTLPSGYCFGNIGGFFGPELKKAGYDGIVISGRASKPVYLWINDDKVQLMDASSLWGKGAYHTGEMLQQSHGAKVRFITTGIAGEHNVRTAIIFASHQSTATGGFGAVMGSKNLKAIAVIGTGKISVANPDELKELNKYTVKISKRYWSSITPGIAMTKHGHLLKVQGRDPCYQCGMQCFRNVYRYGDREELIGLRRCQAMEYYLPWKYSKEDEPLETFFDAPTLANDYSICTFELQSMIDWLHSCYQSGVLNEEQTGLPLSLIGSRQFLEKLLYCIAYRKDFGDILAEGMVRAAKKVPEQARAQLSPFVAPIGISDLASPRVVVVNALLYPMEPRVHQAFVHQTGDLRMAWNINRRNPELSPVTTRVFFNVAKVFWGSTEAGNLANYEGKAQAAKLILNRTYVKDSLGLCDPAWPISYSFNTPDYVGDPGLEARLFTAVTGIPGNEIDQGAERICNLQRAIQIREGRKVPEDDFPLEINFTEPIPGRQIIPDPAGEPLEVTGNILDRDKFISMLKQYYELRGWHKETGLPRADTLTALGLDDLIPDFQR